MTMKRIYTGRNFLINVVGITIKLLMILLIKKTITIEYYLELHFFFLGALLSTLVTLLLLFAKILIKEFINIIKANSK